MAFVFECTRSCPNPLDTADIVEMAMLAVDLLGVQSIGCLTDIGEMDVTPDVDPPKWRTARSGRV